MYIVNEGSTKKAGEGEGRREEVREWRERVREREGVHT